MDSESLEQQTGFRNVFNGLPATRNIAHKFVMPLGHFYSPFLVETNPIKITPPLCNKCRAAINPFASRNRQARVWSCTFCSA